MRGSYKKIKDSDIEQIRNLRKLIGWDPLRKSQWQEILKNTSWMYSVWENNLLVGMGRVLSDARYAMIYDLMVHKKYQNQGLGKKIIKALLKKSKKGMKIGLFVENDVRLIDFYKSQGFERINGMQIIRD